MKKELTALIVSFYRTEYLEKCLSSMRETYPDINIIIGNNGPEDKEKEKLARRYKAEYYQLPFDCGICVGRNMLVDKIKTKYTLIGDDDFFYTERAGVDKMLDLIKITRFNLIGGRINEGGVDKNYQGFIEKNKNHFIYKKLEIDINAQVQPCDLTFNYFVAETKALKDTKWDEQIKVAYEHSTFFIDFKDKGYKIGFTKNAIVGHKPPISIKDRQEYSKYREYRSRKCDKKRFFTKYGIDYCIDMSGRKDVFDGTGMDDIDFLITHFERKECLENLLFSIAKYCPNANITIADQSKKFIAKYYIDLYHRLNLAGLKNKPKAFNIGYDSGLSYSRNFLIENTHRKYKLILEDDFVFTDKTDIQQFVKYLEENIEHGVVGGSVVEHGYEIPFVHDFKKKGKTLRHEIITDINDVGCVLNFFLAKKEIFDDILWDELIKINGEHTDFFYRLSQTKWKIAFLADVRINHDKIQDRSYKDMRARKDGLIYMLKKNGLNKMIYVDGFTYEIDKNDNLINYRQ